MEAVMEGIIFKAKILILWNAPPENIFIIEKIEFELFLKNSTKIPLFIPGRGINVPTL
jgi:hypothetical protein